MTPDITVGDSGTYTIKTPDGVILISRLPNIGTKVMVYNDGYLNPLGYIHIKEQE